MQIGAALVLRWCENCASVRAFETPPCTDGHADCPELACLECGTAIVLAGLPEGGSHVRTDGLTDALWALPRSA